MRHALVCVTEYCFIGGYWAMWWRRSTERVRTVSLFMFHLGAGDGFFVLGVVFVFVLCFVGLAVCLRLLGLCFACAPYPPSYISYEDSSHSEMGT